CPQSPRVRRQSCPTPKRCLRKPSRNTSTWSLLPADLIAQNHSTRHGECCSVVGGHLNFCDVAFERYIHRGLTARVGLSEGNNGSIRHRVPTAVADRSGLEIKQLP